MWIVGSFMWAIAFSMDAFAVSICKGLSMKKATLKASAICGSWFGGFQALMPLIGFFLGSLFREAIENFDHWVAFGLLALIGINMLREALGKDEDEDDLNDSFTFKCSCFVNSFNVCHFFTFYSNTTLFYRSSCFGFGWNKTGFY